MAKNTTSQLHVPNEFISDNFKKITNPKHRDFLLEYIKNGRNGTRAYLSVYPQTSYESARRLASRLLSKNDVQDALKEYYANLWGDKSKAIGIIFDNLFRIANSDIGDVVYKQNGELKIRDFIDIQDTSIIKNISRNIIETKNGYSIHEDVQLFDKVRANVEMAKILNMISDKVELVGKIEIIPAERPAEDDEDAN